MKHILSTSAIALLLTGTAAWSQERPVAAHLLTPADIERAGVSGVIRAPADMWDPSEGLYYIRASDSTLVVQLTALGGLSGAELRSSLGLLSNDVTPVPGVGDEAYQILGGLAIVMRKGSVVLQLMGSMDPFNGAQLFFSPERLVELARTVAGRL